MRADRVHCLGLLADQKVPRLVVEQRRLGVCRLHRNEPHGRPGGSLADRLGVRSVGLAAFYIRLHVGCRHQAHFVAQSSKLPRPMMGARAGFHPDQAGLEPPEERQYLAAAQLSAQHGRAVRAHSVHLEDAFRQIEADDDRLVHGWLPSMDVSTTPTLAHRDAGSRSHPPHQWRPHGNSPSSQPTFGTLLSGARAPM